MQEMLFVLCTLLRNFQIELKPGYQLKKEVMLVVKPLDGLPVKIKPR